MSRGPGRWQRAIIRETRPARNWCRDWIGVRDIWVAVGDAELDAAGVPRFARPVAEEKGLLHAWSPPHPDRERLRHGSIPRAARVAIQRAMRGLVDAGVLEAVHLGGELKVRWRNEALHTALDNLQALFPRSDLCSDLWNR